MYANIKGDFETNDNDTLVYPVDKRRVDQPAAGIHQGPSGIPESPGALRCGLKGGVAAQALDRTEGPGSQASGLCIPAA